MSSPFLRRSAALLATPALALGALAVLPAAPSYAAEADPAPVAAGAAWLETQLTDGLVFNPNFGGFDDYGLSIDVALGLDAVGGHDATVQTITDAIATNLDSYTSYPTGDSTHVLAGSLGKALALATSAGRDGNAFGGTDLVADLEAQVATEAPIAGRIQDTFDGTQPFEADFSNVIGQAFTVQGLDAEGSALVDPATDFLLAQQCAEGFFRLNFAAADAPLQACDADPEASPDTDVTALAVIALQSQTDDAGVQAAVTRATDWLADAQNANGSFGGGTSTEAPNTNSTGLAAWALGTEGDTARAAAAATWVRGLQADDIAPCASGLTPDNGAVAYDAAARTTARGEGITDATEDQFRRASAQALPGLLWAPAEGTGPLTVPDQAFFQQAGRSVSVVSGGGIAPGDTVCVTRGAEVAARTAARSNGQAVARVALPAGTALRTFVLRSGAATVGSATFQVLGAKKLGLTVAKAQVVRGAFNSVKVTGLVRGESVRVFLRGKPVAAGTANAEGVLTKRFKVTGNLGKATVKVVGEFANRTNTTTITVVR
ncbi:hypothetical protein [Nocardioides sp.]|uniref:hypothetical protein n=1 Tax=Nocardioides sp. TaxID=35761 RepID=UPI00286C681C|nr:hypothetical protein [Nocardioides sp.]